MAKMQEVFGNCSCVFTTLGVVAASYIAFNIVCSLWRGIKCFVLTSGVDLRKFGQWAVVTGATDGIGKAYAHELARRGMNIVLISRSQEKLEDVASEIESKSSVQTRIIPIDFTGGPEIYSKIAKETEDLDVGVLVNNVGMSYDFPMYFTEVDEMRKFALINVNTTSVTMMTHHFLPRMLAKNKGAILNISSAAACLPQPLLAVYSATKVYVDFFTKALHEEYKSKGVIIQVVRPYLVATKMSKIRKGNFFAPLPGNYAKAALDTVGVQTVTHGCLSHEIQGFVANKILPTRFAMFIGTSGLKNARSRGMKKRQAKSD